MSLIDNIRGGSGAKPAAGLPQAPAIAARLDFAQAELADLERQHGDAALAEVLSEPGAADRLTALNRQLASARANVHTLTAAHTAALARDDATLRQHREMLQKTQLNALRQHLAARDAATDKLSAALAQAAEQYHILLERSEKAAHTAQAAGFVFDGSQTAHDDLVRLVRYELARLSAAPGNADNMALPGSEAFDPNWQHRPADIPPLADTLKKASADVLARIQGKTAE